MRRSTKVASASNRGVALIKSLVICALLTVTPMWSVAEAQLPTNMQLTVVEKGVDQAPSVRIIWLTLQHDTDGWSIAIQGANAACVLRSADRATISDLYRAMVDLIIPSSAAGISVFMVCEAVTPAALRSTAPQVNLDDKQPGAPAFRIIVSSAK